MSEIKVAHQGYEITFSENENIWRCWSLNVEDTNLAKLRQKINKMVSSALRTMDVECFVLSEWGGSEITKARITSRDAKTGEFWIVKKGSDRRSRISGKFLRPWTSEIEATLEKVAAINEEAKKIRESADALRRTIKPLTNEEMEEFLTTLVNAVQAEID